MESKERLESKGETDTQALKHAENRIRELERDKAGLANQMHSLKQAATQGSQSTSVMNMLTLGDYLNRVENSRKVRNQRSEITDLSQAILPMNETGEKAGLHEELGRPIPK